MVDKSMTQVYETRAVEITQEIEDLKKMVLQKELVLQNLVHENARLKELVSLKVHRLYM